MANDLVLVLLLFAAPVLFESNPRCRGHRADRVHSGTRNMQPRRRGTLYDCLPVIENSTRRPTEEMTFNIASRKGQLDEDDLHLQLFSQREHPPIGRAFSQKLFGCSHAKNLLSLGGVLLPDRASKV